VRICLRRALRSRARAGEHHHLQHHRHGGRSRRGQENGKCLTARACTRPAWLARSRACLGPSLTWLTRRASPAQARDLHATACCHRGHKVVSLCVGSLQFDAEPLSYNDHALHTVRRHGCGGCGALVASQRPHGASAEAICKARPECLDRVRSVVIGADLGRLLVRHE
jgi:hypothetical protein